MEMSNTEASIFVFYKPILYKSWIYSGLHKGWVWTGVGSTPNNLYPREEQFNGPKQSKKEVRTYLDEHFKKLKKDKIVQRYKIRYSYKP